MSIGPSGRIVVEMEPGLKRELHSALLKDGTTLKDWFLEQAIRYLRDGQQPGYGDAAVSMSTQQENLRQS